MNNKTSITELPQVQGVSNNDLLVIQTADATSTIKFEDFVIGPDNASFYKTILDVKKQTDALGTSTSIISAVNNIVGLSATDPGSAGNKTIMYVKERALDTGSDTGGFFMFDYGESVSDNGGTIIDPTSGAVTGRWKRVNYDFVDPRWFGASTTNSDNSAFFQKAIDYSTSAGVYKPVRIPNGTFKTRGLSAGPGTRITGSGNSVLQQVAGDFSGAGSRPGSASTLAVLGDNIIIEDLEIIGTKDNGYKQNNIYIYDCNDVIIRNCRVTTASGNNIVLVNTQRCKITDNLCYDAAGNNIAVHTYQESTVAGSTGSMRNIICNNVVYSSTAKDILEGEHLEAGDSVVGGPNYNIITSNICDAIGDIRITGTNTVTGHNVAHDVDASPTNYTHPGATSAGGLPTTYATQTVLISATALGSDPGSHLEFTIANGHITNIS